MAEQPLKVALLGRDHTVTLPDFAAREELLIAYGENRHRKGVAVLRVYSAMLGLCTRLGRESGADYARHRFDVLAYGGEVYGWIRQRGGSPADLATAAAPLLAALSENLFPSDAEVAGAAGNSEGGAARQTEPPSA